MAETRFQKAVANYELRSHKLVLPVELVIEDFQQFLTFNKPSTSISYEKLPDVMPITTDSLPAVSHPEWGEINDAKASFGWLAERFFTGAIWWKYGETKDGVRILFDVVECSPATACELQPVI